MFSSMKLLAALVGVLCLASSSVVGAVVLRRGRQPSEDAGMPVVSTPVAEMPCEMFGGLLTASVSPTCCFSVNVVAQRGLEAFGLAKPCRDAWDCGNGTAKTVPTAAFERKAVRQMCSEEQCMENTVTAMQANWMTARGASKLGAICEKTAGGAASVPYPSGPALKALLHGNPCDTQECKDKCKVDSCSNKAAKDVFCAYDGNAATNVNNKCYETCCVPSSGGRMGGMACFPGQAQVHTANGLLDMSELRVGDEVLVETTDGRLEHAPVLSFLHTIPAYKAGSYVTLTHEHGILRASENHVIFLCGAKARTERRAGEIRIGDYLCAASAGSAHVLSSMVLKVEVREGASGMFAPLTSSGTVVVDGAVASNYATPDSLPIKHSVMHATLFPLRLYYSYGLDTKLAPLWSTLCALLGWNTACSSEQFELHPYVSFFHEAAHLEKLATLF